ncbi:hypothetical protein OHAE_1324 [Ochrobactrum soli]|uniref:Uncharacterized protein n=1 Tax=Ochrobactrum soli TaxID=2448455 RepID=A0A2P9HMX5_9HYPH|nr:hypothetical protein OHAE_1324 [[Ochrobactrum] soli]
MPEQISGPLRFQTIPEDKGVTQQVQCRESRQLTSAHAPAAHMGWFEQKSK